MNVKLLVVQGRPQGKCLVFPPGEFVFGRGTECHVRPNSDWVSRQHCILHVSAGIVSIRDLGSRNGTLVNGERLVGERDLANGDQLQVGPLVFEVQLQDNQPPVSDPAIAVLAGPQSSRSLPHTDTQAMIDLDGETAAIDPSTIDPSKPTSPVEGYPTLPRESAEVLER